MGVGSGGQGGAVAPLDFHTWYTDTVDRGLIMLFFGLFFRWLPTGKFSANALGDRVTAIGNRGI